jgi:hypothetical protein
MGLLLDKPPLTQPFAHRGAGGELGMAHATDSHDLICQLQDGSRITLRRDEADRLVTTAFVAAGRHKDGDAPLASVTLGFGPWPSWDTNVSNAVDTLPDEDSGLFEPERLFVLREQYIFVTPPVAGAKALSFGPIHKMYWDGTEHVVQARQRSARH